MRTDPTDNGGLFVGRRPGTGPVRYRALPTAGSAARARVDRNLARLLLALQIVLNLTFWGPIPAAWLWVASQIQYQTDNVSIGILVAFIGLLFTLVLGLVVLKRLDHAWILVRRAAGYDQRTGMVTTIFAVCAVVGTILFLVWLLIIQGPGSGLTPGQQA